MMKQLSLPKLFNIIQDVSIPKPRYTPAQSRKTHMQSMEEHCMEEGSALPAGT